MGIVRERALDNWKGMESMVERFACMTCMSCGGGSWDVLIRAKEASETRACAGGRVECLWWVESGSFGGGWGIMGVWRWMCRKGCEECTDLYLEFDGASYECVLDIKPCLFEDVKECWGGGCGRGDGRCDCLYGG